MLNLWPPIDLYRRCFGGNSQRLKKTFNENVHAYNTYKTLNYRKVYLISAQKCSAKMAETRTEIIKPKMNLAAVSFMTFIRTSKALLSRAVHAN